MKRGKTARADVLRLLRADTLTAQQLATRLRVSRSTALAALGGLLREGLVGFEKDGNEKRWRALPNQGA
jgi:predicted ArsR family transcriptional regulator